MGNKATHGVLLERTAYPGVYRRGGQYVAVYRREGRQRKESAATFAEARAIKLARDAEARELRRGPTLHDYALRWVARHAGSGHDSVREQTREEYRRLLATFALSYFPADVRLGDLDRRALQGFIGWLTDRPGRRGRLSDRSIRNALTPLRRCLDAAAGEGLIDGDLARSLVLPSRRGGRRWAVSERRFLTRVQLGRLLAEIPPAHQPLLVLLASTGLGISEAIALRWCDLDLDASPPRLWVRRAIVGGVVGAPKSYYGARAIPLAEELAGTLRAMRPPDAADEDLVFPNRRGRPLNPSNLRNRVLKPAIKRAGVSGIGLHALRHTCASLLIDEGASTLRLQRWMGHHAAAYTLETYGHLIDDELGRALELEDLGVRDCRM
ncbi:MAG: tyrosine-type recombinase/integrase [Solirubrobacterales bacterium]